MRRRSKAPPKPPTPEPRVNERIRVPEVRLIDEEGQQVGVVKTSEALVMARQRNVDLVEVAAQASPPVARLMDFGRFKYEQSKKDREAKKHQSNMQLREIRMKPKIDEHDIDFKTRTAQKLLLEGDKVKVTVMFRGREIVHPQLGKALIDRVSAKLLDVASIEKEASLEGRHMTMILVPDKKKIAARTRTAATSTPAESPATSAHMHDGGASAGPARAPVVAEQPPGEDDESETATGTAETVVSQAGD